MAISVDTEFRLPEALTGPAFSVDARSVLGPERDWRVLQEDVLAALCRLSEAHGHDGVAWFCSLARPEASKAEQRLGLVVSWDGSVGDEESATVLGALRGTGGNWKSEGLRAIPRRAFPSVALKEGFSYQLWVEGRRGLSVPTLQFEDDDLLQARTALDDVVPDAFLPRVIHAVGVRVPPRDQDIDPLEVHKMVFALSVCERLIEADGVVSEGEIEFLRRVFPPRRLERHGLQDRVKFLLLRQNAGDELAMGMPHGEKLSLMGLFWRAGQSDGSVDPIQLQILQDAASQLQLDWDEVEAYLRGIW
jgi:uncharacterized tellurite resistance protein B-like protein